MPHGVSSIGPWPSLIGGDLQLWFGTGTDGSQQGFYRGTQVAPEALESTTVSLADWRARILPLPQAWKLISEGPARAAGLSDRGALGAGKRADILIVDDRVALRPRLVAAIVGDGAAPPPPIPPPTLGPRAEVAATSPPRAPRGHVAASPASRAARN